MEEGDGLVQLSGVADDVARLLTELVLPEHRRFAALLEGGGDDPHLFLQLQEAGRDGLLQ